jgi:hypothetical protein
MKQCTKCKLWLTEDRYVKSDRYVCGLYPSCKDCRKKTTLKTLADHPLCCRCKLVPHARNMGYCLDCDRLRKGKTIERSRSYNRDNKTMCSKCLKNPRLTYHNYCKECKNESVSKWIRKNSPRLKSRPFDPRRRKKSARHYINSLYKRGKVKRKPCEICNDGTPSVNFHHLDYHDRTTNVMHVCLKHHVELERQKRNLTQSKSNGKSQSSVVKYDNGLIGYQLKE